MKKLSILVIFTLVFFGSFASPVLAAESEKAAKNEDTGAGSTNNAAVTETNNTNVTVTNTANIENSTSSSSNTGGNSASSNTGGGTVTSGDATNNVSSSAVANQTSVSTSCNPCGGGSTTAVNSQTGAGSTNNAEINNNNNTTVDVNNNTNVTTNITTNASTGGNTASYNNGNGTIETGNINSNISSTVNTNNTNISVGQQGRGGNLTINASNISTGANSYNTTLVNSVNNITVNSIHDATINTMGWVKADSGSNEALYNLGNGFIETGDITLLGKFKESANMTKANIFCSFCQANILTMNKNTGAGSVNISDPSVFNSIIVLEKKVADISDLFFLDLSTGKNKVNGNGGDGFIKTGNILIDFSKVVSANNDVINIGGGLPPTPPPDGENPPSNPPGGGSSNQPGQILASAASTVAGIGGEVLSAVLPATGASLELIALFSMMSVMGVGLRRKAAILSRKR